MMHPDDADRRVSHETIYTSIYACPRGSLTLGMIEALRQRTHVRGRRRTSLARGQTVPEAVRIVHRPEDIEQRLLPGHWEGNFDLAQAYRDHYSNPTSFALWVLCEIAIAACDLAEVIVSAIALNLLFGIPMTWGNILTALDVMLILVLQHRGFRMLEAIVIVLVATVGACFLFELIITRPSLAGAMHGFIPATDIISDKNKLYIAIGILGATVMPHNRYLHSSICADAAL